MAVVLQEDRLAHRQVSSVNMKDARESYLSFSPEALSYRMLAKNFKVTNSKHKAEVTFDLSHL